MQHQQSNQQYAAPPPTAGTSIGIGPQVAITFGTVVVLGIVNGFFERLVTQGLGLSSWVMVVVFALLTALAGRKMERVRRGDLGAMWFAAFLSWFLSCVYALARATALPDMLVIWVAVAALLGWRWFDVRRGLRDRLLGPLRERSS